MSPNDEDKIDAGVPSEHLESGYPKYETEHDNDPFGNEEFGEVKYRTLTWWQAGLIMIAETVSLGILSLPSAIATLGLAPGIILIVGLGAIATYTAYVMGQFKLRYPQVHNMADVGEILLGRIGREILGSAQLIILVFVCGSHLLTWNIMMNTVTDHGTCTVVFGVVGMILSMILALPRTLKKVSWLSIASFISIIAATLITMITIGIQRPGNGHVDATTHKQFYVEFVSVTNIVFAYASHVAFFGFISEMQKPTDFPKTILLLQGVDVSLYVVAAVVIYRYGGENVVSPALGSISPLMSKIAYGIAIPTIIIAGVINGHVACKYVYVRIFRGTNRMQERSLVSVGSWVAIVFTVWVIAWVIAESIPIFNNLLSLIASLFASWFTYGLSGVFWLFLNWGQYFDSPKKIFLTLLNVTIFGIGGCLCGLGLYVSGKAIHDSPVGTSFAC